MGISFFRVKQHALHAFVGRPQPDSNTKLSIKACGSLELNATQYRATRELFQMVEDMLVKVQDKDPSEIASNPEYKLPEERLRKLAQDLGVAPWVLEPPPIWCPQNYTKIENVRRGG